MDTHFSRIGKTYYIFLSAVTVIEVNETNFPMLIFGQINVCSKISGFMNNQGFLYFALFLLAVQLDTMLIGPDADLTDNRINWEQFH